MSSEEKKEQSKCNYGCCNYMVTPYVSDDHSYTRPKTKIKKAGGFIFNRTNNKILMVQSRGQLWGPPKGTMMENETPTECAIREIHEETGVLIDESVLKEFSIIKSKAVYYHIEIDETEKCEKWSVVPQTHIKNNDANGIGWFNIDCLNDLIESKKISINQHCRLLIKRIFKKEINFSPASPVIQH